MNLKEFSKEELFGNKDFVTNEEVLLTKEQIKSKKLFDNFYLNKIKSVHNIGFEDKLNQSIPFERGVFVRKQKMKILSIDNNRECLYLFADAINNTCYAFQKQYIDFIEKYLDIYTYTIVKTSHNRHILKFWGYNHEFLGCLATINLSIAI